MASQRRVATGFFSLFYLIIVGFPCAILYFQGYQTWVWICPGLAVILLAAHARVAHRVLCALEREDCDQVLRSVPWRNPRIGLLPIAAVLICHLPRLGIYNLYRHPTPLPRPGRHG